MSGAGINKVSSFTLGKEATQVGYGHGSMDDVRPGPAQWNDSIRCQVPGQLPPMIWPGTAGDLEKPSVG